MTTGKPSPDARRAFWTGSGLLTIPVAITLCIWFASFFAQPNQSNNPAPMYAAAPLAEPLYGIAPPPAGIPHVLASSQAQATPHILPQQFGPPLSDFSFHPESISSTPLFGFDRDCYMHIVKALYPAAMDPRTPFGICATEVMSEMKARNDARLCTEEAPLIVATLVARKLGVAPTPPARMLQTINGLHQIFWKTTQAGQAEAIAGFNFEPETTWRMSMNAATQLQSSGFCSFFVSKNGITAMASVHYTAAGRAYLKTIPDGTTSDNFSDLPEGP